MIKYWWSHISTYQLCTSQPLISRILHTLCTCCHLPLGRHGLVVASEEETMKNIFTFFSLLVLEASYVSSPGTLVKHSSLQLLIYSLRQAG